MTTLFTIGYEGVDLEKFVNNLKLHGINLLIDVREKPLSRKKGFSKKALNTTLKKHDIDYIHVGELGSPSEIRNELYHTNNYGLFFKKYLNYLKYHDERVQELVCTASENNRVCLMCFEKDHYKCHRSVITDYLLAKYSDKVQVEHL